MTFTVSAVAVLGIAAFFLIRSGATGIGAALVLFLFGFFTAGTGAYHPIHNACLSLAAFLTHPHT